MNLDPTRTQTGERLVAWLYLDTQAAGASSIATLHVADLTGSRYSGSQASGADARPGRLFIVEREPLLDVAREQEDAILTLYGVPGAHYRLESTPSLRPPLVWSKVQSLPLTDDFAVLRRAVSANHTEYYRVVSE